MNDQKTPIEFDQKLQLRIVSDDKLRMSGLMKAERDSDARKTGHGVHEANSSFPHLGYIVVGQKSAVDNAQESLKGMQKNLKKADEDVKKTNPHSRRWSWLDNLF